MDQNLPTFKSNRSQPQNSQPESQNQSGAKVSFTNDDGSHLDDLRMNEIENENPDPDAPFEVGDDGEPVGGAPKEAIDKDAFWVVFQTAFNLPGQLMRDLQPLAIQDQEQQGARAASDATHSLLAIYYPSALLPQSETIAHLLVAGPFFVGKVLIVREILRAMKAKPIKQSDGEQPKEKPEHPKASPNDAPFENLFLPGQEPGQ